MVHTRALSSDFQVECSNELATLLGDTVGEKGGSGRGFRPHDLLEAAFAACLNISVRMEARARGIDVGDVRTAVSLDRSLPNRVVFEYSIEIDGYLSQLQSDALLAAANTSAIRTTLSKEIGFRAIDPPELPSERSP